MGDERWGRIANRGMNGQRVKGVYFFAGDWRSNYRPTAFYPDGSSNGPNDHLYTVHPADGRHLGWSVSAANRRFAVDEMRRAGANVVVMSYWGERGTERWRYWAPMQTSTYAHDELFDEVADQPLLVMPAIESGAAAGGSPEFSFENEFPPADLASSQFVTQILDLINRYVVSPRNPAWPDRWVRLFDQDGQSRLAIHVLHVRSARLGAAEHTRFAKGFDDVANYIADRFKSESIRIGFTLDALRRPVICGKISEEDLASYFPTPAEAGESLRAQKSVLAIQGFIPEISLSPERSEADRVVVKREYVEAWSQQGIPVLNDLTPGYDGHLVFSPPVHKKSGIYGNHGGWRRELLALLPDRFSGVVFNTWNGYTEGYAAIPTTEFGEDNWGWMQRVFRKWSDVGTRFAIKPGTEVSALWREPDTQLELFVTGLDGGVWTTWWEPGRNYAPWAPVITALTPPVMTVGATVTAVARETRKHLDLFVTGADGTVWTIWRNDDPKSWPAGWLSVHPETKMQPGATVTAVWREPGKHLDLFVTGADGTVWTVWWNDTASWRPEGWILLHPETKMQPGATVTAVWREPGKHLDVFSTTADGTVWSIWWNDADGWRPAGWLALHPETKMQAGAAVTAVWREAGKHLDLFACGTDGTVWSTWWNDLVGWRPDGWLSIHPEIKMAAGAKVTAVWRVSGKHLDLFATGPDGTVWATWWIDLSDWRPEGWFFIKDGFELNPGQTITALWSNATQHLDLFGVGKDGRVVTAWWESDLGW